MADTVPFSFKLMFKLTSTGFDGEWLILILFGLAPMLTWLGPKLVLDAELEIILG